MTTAKTQPFSAPGYESLAQVLQRAFDQAASGKGKERHANELPFDQQPMQTIASAHGVGFLTGQAAKKMQEARGLSHDAAIRELLGAINYIAGAVIFMEGVRKNSQTMPYCGCTIVCGGEKADELCRNLRHPIV